MSGAFGGYGSSSSEEVSPPRPRASALPAQSSTGSEASASHTACDADVSPRATGSPSQSAQGQPPARPAPEPDPPSSRTVAGFAAWASTDVMPAMAPLGPVNDAVAARLGQWAAATAAGHNVIEAMAAKREIRNPYLIDDAVAKHGMDATHMYASACTKAVWAGPPPGENAASRARAAVGYPVPPAQPVTGAAIQTADGWRKALQHAQPGILK